MANGIAAKYKTPALKPLPASSPIWLAVLVQIEHCPKLMLDNNRDRIRKDMLFMNTNLA